MRRVSFQTFLLPALTAGLFSLVGAACSNSTMSTGPTGSTGSGGSTTTSSNGSGPGCPGNLAAAPSSEFCAKNTSPTNCALVTPADHTQVCGVPLPSPTTELARSPNVKEFAGSGPPDLGCFAPAGYPKQGTPVPVQISGVAKIFSHGCQSKQLTIEIHTVKRTGGSDDADLGPLVGTAVTTPADCMATGLATMVGDCGTRYECKYTYDAVPSETELVILTKGALWAPLYEYNNFIPTAEVKNGVWTHDVRALAVDDYSVIAQAAIGTSVTPGNGAVAGEVHDCGNVRLTHATVETNVQRRALTYFTSDEVNPLPASAATSTSVLGLYAALDVPPGPASVAALGLVGGKITTVGYFKARVFADSVSVVTFHGLQPGQIKP